MKLTPLALEKLNSEETRMRVCLDLGISLVTLWRWMKSNNKRLHSLDAQKSISTHTGLSIEDVYEQTAAQTA